MATNAYRDENNVPALTAVSSADGQTIVRVYVDPTTHALSTTATIAAGTEVIGHVITDTGSVVAATLAAETTKVIGTVNASAFSYAHVAAGQATTVIKGSAGTLHSITLNSAATATNVTTIYDNASGSGTVIAIPNVVAATVPTTLIFDCSFALGLTIITTNANGGDMTVCYK